MSDEIQNLCRKCGTNLTQGFLLKLDMHANRWLVCPNANCDQVHARVSGGIDSMPRLVAITRGLNVQA